MKTLLLMLLVASPALAGGPKYRQADPKLNDEVENIYHDLGAVLKGTIGPLTISSMTVSSATITYQRGVTDGSNASSGGVGEYTESIISANTNATTQGQYADLTSISLTAGDWDVEMIGRFRSNGATWSLALMGIGTTSGNNGPFDDATQTEEFASTSTAQIIRSFSTYKRLSLSSTTTVYLKYYALYSAGTPQAVGKICARRVR